MNDLVHTTENLQQDLQRKISDAQLTASEANKYLSFNLKGTVYGVNILGIKEIIEFGQITQVPMAPAYIRGVINLRGNVVPIIDLAVRLGKPRLLPSKKSCIIVLEMELEGEGFTLGFMVDGVNEVIDIPAGAIEASPSFGVDIRTDFIDGMGRVGDNFVVLLDLNTVLSVEELARFFGDAEAV